MKKLFVFGLISALILTGAIAIFAVLSGDFSELQARILMTTVSVFFYSIVGLCCNTLMGGKYQSFGYFGIFAAFASLLFAVFHTWTISDGGDIFSHIQLRSSLFFVGVAFAHASLMLLIYPKNFFVSGAIWLALGCNLFFTVIVVTQIISLSSTGLAAVIQIQIILCIIGVIATIIAPLANRFG